jgi:hypothetical protein
MPIETSRNTDKGGPKSQTNAVLSHASQSVSMADRQDHPVHGPRQLPFRMRDSQVIDTASDKAPSSNSRPSTIHAKYIPETLHFSPRALRHFRSPTESSISSISSANVPDSATTYSLSTVASPVSTSYASDLHDLFPTRIADGSRSSSRVLHRHQASCATCSTFVNDEDDGELIPSYVKFGLKSRAFDSDIQSVDEVEEPVT